MFEFWKEMTLPPLNFAVKPSGAISIILNAIAESLAETTPPWRHEALFKDLVTRTFANANGFLLVDNMFFRPFDGLYFGRVIPYAPETRIVAYSARDIMVSTLSNGGTLIVFAQLGSASEFRPTGSFNPYNMNWVLSYVGSRVYFPTGVNTSAKRDAMPLAHGTPAGERPLLAGWTRFVPPYLPYATTSPYHIYTAANTKLFLDVNRANLGEGLPLELSTYSKYILPKPIETPSPYPPLTTYLYEIEVPNADYVIVAFDYIIASVGTKIEVLDSKLNPVWTYNVMADTETYGVLSAPVKGVGGSTKLYVKFASGFDVPSSHVPHKPSLLRRRSGGEIKVGAASGDERCQVTQHEEQRHPHQPSGKPIPHGGMVIGVALREHPFAHAQFVEQLRRPNEHRQHQTDAQQKDE
jgi:hypothetical protein